jgi:TatD DNase family protein
MIDTHAHIYGSEFANEQAELVQRCKDAGVSHVILPNVDEESLAEITLFHEKFPDFTSMMVGIHPTSIGEDYQRLLDLFDAEVSTGKYIAIGETGLDLYWDKIYIKEQKISFEHHIDVAISKDLPICIHCRDSYAEIIDSLKKFKGKSIRGVVHAFSLYPENAKQYLEYGDFYFGLGGVITYKNAKFPERLAEIPLDRILLETDSPYLTPQPHRGKRNEPTYLVHIAEKIAQIYGVSPEEIKNKTTENAQRLFF